MEIKKDGIWSALNERPGTASQCREEEAGKDQLQLLNARATLAKNVR